MHPTVRLTPNSDLTLHSAKPRGVVVQDKDNIGIPTPALKPARALMLVMGCQELIATVKP